MEASAKYPGVARARITLENGNIVVVDEADGDELIRVGAGGVIQWNADAPIKWWAIVMKGDTPFDGNTGWAGSNQGQQGVTRVRQDANGGGTGTRRYAYAIVVSDGQDVVFRDPEFEVGPRDGGG